MTEERVAGGQGQVRAARDWNQPPRDMTRVASEYKARAEAAERALLDMTRQRDAFLKVAGWGAALAQEPPAETELEAARRRFPHDLGGDVGRLAWHREHPEPPVSSTTLTSQSWEPPAGDDGPAFPAIREAVRGLFNVEAMREFADSPALCPECNAFNTHRPGCPFTVAAGNDTPAAHPEEEV